ncbi:MAG TPA: NAD+ synthase, partial [bacterium]|nr:NAD+ synthase [bacterium]
AALCAEALGRANTYGIILPCHTAAGAGLAHARLIVKTLGICHLELDITAQVETYFKNFPQADSVRRGNKIARERMSVLYDLSSHFGALVVGTSNKSERYLGYGTIYGDMACAINPVGDLYKTEMYQLAEYLKIPAEIVRKAPSAELWPGQTDEDELGFSYAEIDQVLHAYVDRKLSPEEIVRNLGLKETLVKRVAELVRKSEFKRRLPLVANIPQEIKYVKEP